MSAMCDDCKAAEAALNDPQTSHAISCLVWGLPNPRPEDCDCGASEIEEGS